MLELKNLNKTYSKKNAPVTAMQDVSLTVKPGDFLAIQGPSGCGKTTLLLTAGGLLTPDSGSVLLNGDSIYQKSSEKLAAYRGLHIGFAFQQYHLIPYLTVEENILAPLLAGGFHDKDKLKAHAQELIEHFGLRSRVNHRTAELSAGEKQRTALARALLNRPKLLLADEITGNLDHENAKTVLSYLQDFAAEGGMVVLVTHDERAAKAASHEIHMKDGRFV